MKNLISFLQNIGKEQKTSTWKLAYSWFKPAQEGLREALCALGNGYMATRGAAPEAVACRIHYPGTYMAGVYNKVPTRIAGRDIYNEDLVNCPNWLSITFRIGKGPWFSPSNQKIIQYYQELNMRRGILTRKMTIQNKQGLRTSIETQRFISMSDPHCAGIRYTIIPENYDGEITIRSGLDGRIQNTGVARYRELTSRHLNPITIGEYGRYGIYLSVKTSQSKIEISQAAKIGIFHEKNELRVQPQMVKKGRKAIYQEVRLDVRRRQRYTLEKTVAIYTSKDKGVRKPLATAVNAVKRYGPFNDLLAMHKRAWDELWNMYDIEIDSDPFVQKVLRLHTFHLLQSASKHNTMIDAGVLARGLHGEAYRGHIFWDELFVMPFYDMHLPEVSKALMIYRYNRLRPAREYAAESGYKGAMFPWQSGSTGVEETQVIHLNPLSGKWDPDYSCIQRHVSFAIAYNVWQYYKRTRDIVFLVQYGAEMLLSIAQFGASLSYYDKKDGKYHTKNIMGPDEFHEKMPNSDEPGYKDNAYTNVLIVLTLQNAIKSFEIVPEEHRKRLLERANVTEKDIEEWKIIARKMNIIMNKEGILAQFDGYFSLKELDWESYKKKYGNIHRMDRILKAEGKSPNDYKVAKQADVLMLFYLYPFQEIKAVINSLGYKFDKTLLKKNYEYYVKRTSHGSTLSKVVHCYVSHIMGRTKEAWNWFIEVLKSDIDDTQGGTTPEGIHCGVMAGSLTIVMRGLAGIQFVEDCLKIDPMLPSHWNSMKLKFLYRGNWISLHITKRILTMRIRRGKSKQYKVPIAIYGKLKEYQSGTTYKIDLKNISE